MYTPVNPSFTIRKWGLRAGSKLDKYVFVMEREKKNTPYLEVWSFFLLLPILLKLIVYSTGRFVLSLALCYFVLVLFSPFSIAITSLGEKRANLSAFRTFV